ncbi:MAG TPA: hypothetical protein PKV75_07590 [Desulfobacterales bacterium]|nr:hypothetical protein [Desulfobacterales bacterium]
MDIDTQALDLYSFYIKKVPVFQKGGSLYPVPRMDVQQQKQDRVGFHGGERIFPRRL